MAKPKPPANISQEAKQVWRKIFDETEMDAPGLLLLNTVAESFNRMRQAQALIAKQGIVLEETTDAGTVKYRVNPACGVERDSKAAMMRAWKLLGFDQAPPGLGK